MTDGWVTISRQKKHPIWFYFLAIAILMVISQVCLAGRHVHVVQWIKLVDDDVAVRLQDTKLNTNLTSQEQRNDIGINNNAIGSGPPAASLSITAKDRWIMYMHVGKTGGKTMGDIVLAIGCKIIRKQLKRDNCMQEFGPESDLSKQVKGLTHCEKSYPSKTRIETASDYLFTVREPISRFESWYRFSDPRNCVPGITSGAMCQFAEQVEQDPDTSFAARFYLKFFPSINDIGRMLDPLYVNNTVIDQADCRDLLQKGFQTVGKAEGQYKHLVFNYRHYVSKAELIRHNKPVWVVRTEHFWADIQRLDRTLGGGGNFSRVEGSKNSYGSEAYSHKIQIDRQSETSLSRVCCALWPDVLAYRQIVDRAANLNAAEKMETYQLTWNKCKVTSWKMLEERCHAIDLIF